MVGTRNQVLMIICGHLRIISKTGGRMEICKSPILTIYIYVQELDKHPCRDFSIREAKHIPYRDSRLTFFLQDSLGGNAKLTILLQQSFIFH